MISRNVPIKPYTYYKIGGAAKYFSEVTTVDELAQVLSEWKRICEKENIPLEKVFILGGGSNVLFSDKGFSGLVILNKLKRIEINGAEVTVGSGVSISKLSLSCSKAGLSGLEWAVGLPGTVGGAVVGNSGCFGSEIKDIVKSIIGVNIPSGNQTIYSNKECKFEYRGSGFKGNAEKVFIAEATFLLKVAELEEVMGKSLEIQKARREKQPLEYPSCGSVFKNVPWERLDATCQSELKDFIKTEPMPVVPAGVLIDKAGLKGLSVGGAMVSEKHANFIVNYSGNATSDDVLRLMELVSEQVKDRFGVGLEPEIGIIGD
ncbi:UDP-N-acetylmuramate dehydrogenase [Candidatus Dojkabacteria bacterium]|nr:UDP-N-acetylmuramate dehydrogenase [Candidatus Dojkabacteria bacterium]